MAINTVKVLPQINLDTKLADFTVFNWRPLGTQTCLKSASVAAVQGLGLDLLFGSEDFKDG